MSDLVIYKHNELIDNFIFNATELELQILNYAVATTNPHWENKNAVYTISIHSLVNTYKTKSKDAHKRYKDALIRLMDRKYTYIDTDGELCIENLITRTKPNKDNKNSLQFRLNDYISTRISNLQGFFTKYDIENIAKFRSRYAFMLYEFFKMLLNKNTNKKKYKLKISIEDLKMNLGIAKKYTQYKDFNNRVLSVAQDNINKHSDIRISYKMIAEGRKPTFIIFEAKNKITKELKPVVLGTNEIQNEIDLIAEQKDKNIELNEDQLKFIKFSANNNRVPEDKLLQEFSKRYRPNLELSKVIIDSIQSIKEDTTLTN